MKKRVFFAILSATLVLGIAFHLPAQGRETRTVRVSMGYIPNVQFAPWYVAEALGYFAREDIKVEMDYSMDVDGLLLLGQGKKDFAVAGGDMVIIGRSQGLPITYVATLYARFPVSIVSLAAADIKTLGDLRGKRVGLPFLSGTSYIAMRAMLAQAKMQESDLRLLAVGYTQIQSLLTDKIDAAVVFANNEPVQLAVQGHKFFQINSSDYFPLVGHGLVTSERLIKEDPALVRAFTRATVKAMDYTLHNPKEAFKLVQKAIDLPEKDAEVQYRVLQASMRLWENAYTGKHGLGSSDPAAWADSQRFMLEHGFIKSTTDVRKIMSNAFLK